MRHLKWLIDQDFEVFFPHHITKRDVDKETKQFGDGFFKGSAVGSVLGPVGTVLGGIIGGFFCMQYCEGT